MQVKNINLTTNETATITLVGEVRRSLTLSRVDLDTYAIAGLFGIEGQFLVTFDRCSLELAVQQAYTIVEAAESGSLEDDVLDIGVFHNRTSRNALTVSSAVNSEVARTAQTIRAFGLLN